MSKISKITIGATINVGNYQSRTFSYDIDNVTDVEKDEEFLLKRINERFEKYGKFGIPEENKVPPSIDKIKELGI